MYKVQLTQNEQNKGTRDFEKSILSKNAQQYYEHF